MTLIQITNKIIEDIKLNKVLPWEKKWFSIPKTNITNIKLENNEYIVKTYYKGLNRMLLGNDPEDLYITFAQCKTMKGYIKKGSKARIVFFWLSKWQKEEEDKYGNKVIVEIDRPVLKTYQVFMFKDTEGIERPKFRCYDNERITTIDEFVSNLNIKINYGGSKAFYSPSSDTINIPEISRFESSNYFYHTLFHELIHLTGSKNRLHRYDVFDEMKDKAIEELTAEIGSCFLMNRFGIDMIEHSETYLNNWLTVLDNNPSYLYTASKNAELSIEYILDNLKSSPSIKAA